MDHSALAHLRFPSPAAHVGASADESPAMSAFLWGATALAACVTGYIAYYGLYGAERDAKIAEKARGADFQRKVNAYEEAREKWRKANRQGDEPMFDPDRKEGLYYQKRYVDPMTGSAY